MPAAKLAVSLPKTLFDEVEKTRKRQGLTRSAVVQVGLRAWLDALREEDRVRKYIGGYLKHPETDEELAVADAILRDATRKRRRR